MDIRSLNMTKSVGLTAGGTILFFVLFLSCPGDFQGMCRANAGDVSPENRLRVMAGKGKSDLNIGALCVSFFQKHISAVDGERCSCLPSCSSYSAAAFRTHGFLMGWLMTVDRLIREGDEGAVSPLVFCNGRLKILDPVENNDFWWFRLSVEDEN